MLKKLEGGARLKEIYKKGTKDKLLISVVTVVYNKEKTLEETILSVINQTYDNVEYIIVDGGSTDGTLEIIKKYNNKIDYWVSEKDEGIYDAMNKGIDFAIGKWVNFMNGGDCFYRNDVIEKIFYNKKYENIDFIYGNDVVDYKKYVKKRYAKKLRKDLSQGMICSHQSLFSKLCLLKKRKFNTTYKTVADFEMIYDFYNRGLKFSYIDLFISKHEMGGISEINAVQSIKEEINVVKKYNNLNFYKLYYNLMVVFIKIFIKKAIGEKSTDAIIEFKNVIINYKNMKYK